MSLGGSVQPDVVRIKVYKPDSNLNDDNVDPSLSKKFCIDPRLTSYRTLQCLIAQAFDIKTDFTISSIHKCPTTGREQLTPIWSDWDLDASIQTVQSGSFLRLRYYLTSREDDLDDWDFIGMNDLNANMRWFQVDSRSIIATVNQTAGKAASALNRAINWMYGANDRRNGKPIGENDLKKFLDSDARLIYVNELRQAIYEGGVVPSFRKVVWRHLLNIFPASLTGLERINYLKYVTMKYETLKNRWVHDKNPSDQIRLIMRTINKDVLRTDRAFGFYADSDDGNVNIQSLFHILTTYCVSHPSVNYCQGMNDYASALLYVMREESLAYVCFCSVMKRIRGNFTTDGITIGTKLLHLKVLLKAIDPVYWSFFESCDAVNLFFTYRWLLLECKREFPFNDALRVLEVMWATLPIDPDPPVLSELVLITSPSDTMICEILHKDVEEKPIRRATSCPQLFLIDEPIERKVRHRSSSLTSPSQDQTKSIQRQTTFEQFSPTNSNDKNEKRFRSRSVVNSVSVNGFSDLDFDSLAAGGTTTTTTTSQHSASQVILNPDWVQNLPISDSNWLNEGNSFLLFLCVSLLLYHRNYLLKQTNLDEQEISMHFDRYRRRHHAERILNCARTLYGQYVQSLKKKRIIDDLTRFSTS